MASGRRPSCDVMDGVNVLMTPGPPARNSYLHGETCEVVGLVYFKVDELSRGLVVFSSQFLVNCFLCCLNQDLRDCEGFSGWLAAGLRGWGRRRPGGG